MLVKWAKGRKISRVTCTSFVVCCGLMPTVLSISFQATSLVQGQSYDCQSNNHKEYSNRSPGTIDITTTNNRTESGEAAGIFYSKYCKYTIESRPFRRKKQQRRFKLFCSQPYLTYFPFEASGSWGKWLWFWMCIFFQIRCGVYFHTTVFMWMVQDPLIISQHWFKLLLGRHQATSHYWNQFCLRSGTPYGVTRPQWVKYTTTPSLMNKKIHQS